MEEAMEVLSSGELHRRFISTHVFRLFIRGHYLEISTQK